LRSASNRIDLHRDRSALRRSAAPQAAEVVGEVVVVERRDDMLQLLAMHHLGSLEEHCPKHATFPVTRPAPAGLRCKTVHLIRHAQGTHNLGELEAERKQQAKQKAEWQALRDEHGIAWYLLESVTGLRFWDPPLTGLGRRQASRLRREVQRSNVTFDAIYSSPMRRTLQTAMIGLPQIECMHKARPWWRKLGGWLRKERCAPPPVVTTDLLRERIANYTCDARGTVTQLAAEFPGVDFGEVSEEDRPFVESKEHGKQEHPLMRARARRAVEWILARPAEQRVVAVVAHSHFLLALLGLFEATTLVRDESGRLVEPVNVSEAGARFANAERRAMHICVCQNDAQAGCDPTCANSAAAWVPSAELPPT